MKSIIVNGKWLNEKMGDEAEIYLDGKFNEEKDYRVFSDRSVQDEHGHECAVDFISDEVANELKLIAD